MTVPIPLSLPPISDEDKAWLSYNPNTGDVIDWIQDYARRALLASASIPEPSVWKIDWPEEQDEEPSYTENPNIAELARQMGRTVTPFSAHPITPSSPPSSVETSNTAAPPAPPFA